MSALAPADIWIVHNDWPQSRELTVKEFNEMRGKSSTGGGSCTARCWMASS